VGHEVLVDGIDVVLELGGDGDNCHSQYHSVS
jgi:hypothetical protein